MRKVERVSRAAKRTGSQKAREKVRQKVRQLAHDGADHIKILSSGRRTSLLPDLQYPVLS